MKRYERTSLPWTQTRAVRPRSDAVQSSSQQVQRTVRNIQVEEGRALFASNRRFMPGSSSWKVYILEYDCPFDLQTGLLSSILAMRWLEAGRIFCTSVTSKRPPCIILLVFYRCSSE